MDSKEATIVQGKPVLGARGYEHRDLSVGWIFGIVLFLACCGVMIHLMLAALLEQFSGKPTPGDRWQPERTSVRSRPGPGPQLQISARMDLRYFRAQEDKQLTNYGWVDRKSGIVRLPIERAMELVLQEGLPTITNQAGANGRSPRQLILDRLPAQRSGGEAK